VGSDSITSEFAYNESVNRRTEKIPFQIIYGMNPRGVSELRDMKHSKFRSTGAEEFTAEMQELHNQIKEQLKKRSSEHKHRVDQHRRNLEFEVGDQVLSHLRKERFPRGTYNKLKLKKIGRCKILRRFGDNSYELELAEDVGISPIFKIADLYPYKEDGAERFEDQGRIQWEKQMHVAEKLQMEKIIDQRVGKKNRRKMYFEYLVKWKG
jgi:hypothetical protein